MPLRLSDEEFAALPIERQRVILYDRKRAQRNTERRKEHGKVYREKNKEKIQSQKKVYYNNNKDRFQEYYQNNKEQTKMHHTTNTDFEKTKNKISSWIHQGFKHTPEQFIIIYEQYHTSTKCELCSVPLVEGFKSSNTKCADHHHMSGCFRNVVCHKCNMLRGSQDIAHKKMMLEIRRLFFIR
jgi:hypothetical protein